ncbi:nucleoside triphosphate pyrophosphohydrolase [Microbaculum marinisediminis]|uniref:Nucleoside triphosphate pyrophosphohydrolase n=1 Tax=Microbaculum marinisediminis TaxID=2931392 RepID=A0AAW5R649_9HYPH|nr:nucleoside triphosphate pyrophosphohydrolase [Microbaculum sp. A6E488]MCT8974158.1 nucleoside triphosphate pyrophosphohydrolase [Microbaculum sp. A6E488]
MRPSKDIHTLLDIMAALRTPVTGCPWDLEQDFATIAPYTIEEAYEVADAIARDDLMDLKDELGDLLLQVVFHARMAEEIGAFSFGDVVAAITTKMIRRHPHVFAATKAATPEAVKRNWEDIKAEEKAERHAERETPGPASLLDDVPLALPALQRAVKLQKRAARVGFDWDDSAQVIAKIHEEIDEVSEAAEAGDRGALADEIGDVLFAVANFARHFGVDPEDALRGTNDKFRRRFAHIEQQARAEGTPLEAVTLERMEGWWQDAKKTEGAPALSRGAALSRTAD